MKKFLLGTTVLGAAALFAGAAAADTPKITLGVVADFQLGVVDQDQDTDQRSHGFRSDTELSFAIDGETAGGTRYGGLIILEADINDDADGQGGNAARTLLYIEGDNWGRFEGGSTYGVASTLKVDASRIARATGGIDGDFRYYLNNTGTTAVIYSPDLLLDHGTTAAFATGSETTENLNKVNYYTPRWSGFQAGVSYIVESPTANRGQGSLAFLSDDDGAQAENIFEVGLNYEGQWDEVTIAAAATGVFGSSELSTSEDLRNYNFGLQLGYQGFGIAASYGTWEDSLKTSGASDDEAWYWTAGISYETGPFGFSATYLQSENEVTASTDNEFQNLSIGADYKYAPGFTPYVEVSFIEMDAAAGAADDNDATVFIVGSQLAF